MWDQEKLKQEIEDADPQRCRSIWNASRSRSESLKKRARPAGNEQQVEDGDCAPGPFDTASDVDSAYHDDSQDMGEDASETSALDEPVRGRRRKRESEEHSGMDDLYGVKRSRLGLLA